MPEEKTIEKKPIRVWEIVLMIVLGVAIVGGGVYAYEKWQAKKDKAASSTASAVTSTDSTMPSSSSATDSSGKVTVTNIDDEIRAATNSVDSVSSDNFDDSSISNASLGL